MTSDLAHLSTGRQDDDCCRDDIRHLLAALPHLLHRFVAVSRNQSVVAYSRNLPRDLLAGHVERNVQPNYLLLDELEVLLPIINSILAFCINASNNQKAFLPFSAVSTGSLI